jgi:hypothetical protein
VADEQRRYKALSHIIVGGRLLYPKDREFVAGAQFGDALVKEGRAAALPDEPKGRYNRRDMRAKGDDG